MTAISERFADSGVELAALVVGRAHDQHPLTCLVCGEIFLRDRLVPLLGCCDLAHAILVLEERQCVSDPAFRGKGDSLPKIRIALAPDDF